MQSEEIPTIVDNPIECLRKWFDATLKDTNQSKDIQPKVRARLKTLDRSRLPVKYKAWIYQHGILPRFMWMFLIYERAMTQVEGIERTVNSFVRR